MPAAVPLNNAIAQNSLDFNNQNPTNKGGLFRYKINNYESLGACAINQHTFTNADLNAVCIFTYDVNITIPPFATIPGSEILFYSPNGRIKLEASDGSTLYSNIGNFTVPGKAGKVIYTDSNNWFFSSLNTNSFATNYTDCCAQPNSIYQVGNNGDLNTTIKVYTNAAADVAFNGTIILDNVAQYDIVNGQASSVLLLCYANYYNTAYTFYTEDISYPGEVTPITFYSLSSGITPSNYNSLLGKKFFTAAPEGGGTPVYDCYSSNAVAPGSIYSYYGSSMQYPSDPVKFLNGYVIDFNGIPYMGVAA